ncbi:MAG: carbamoyltransferase HypF [Bacteroidia bacterium]
MAGRVYTYGLHIRGQVQGVGFRPFVYRLATTLGLSGWVCNDADGVHIAVNATAEGLAQFVAGLHTQAPALARITALDQACLPDEAFGGFGIRHSGDAQAFSVLLSPDFGLCPACRSELHDPGDRRYRYPFISCTHCGPRFSIVTALPYDRERSTMSVFALCPACQAEYDDVRDRRYYAQTTCCAACGVSLFGDAAASADPLAHAQHILRSGGIVAGKGIGGYLLLCDATDAAAVARLRARKQRPTKPFALLYPHLAMLDGDVVLTPTAEQLLTSPAAPIVLLPRRAAARSGLAAHVVAPGLDRLGVMLPYAPLLELLARDLDRPLVATSGNLSGSPIAYTTDQAQAYLGDIADAMLHHDREIVVPQDDSVVLLVPGQSLPVMVRRGRGYAPTVPDLAPPRHPEMLALGADLKAAFAWQRADSHYLSQYLGDLACYESQEQLEHVLRHLAGVFGTRPRCLLADAHPGYHSGQLAARLAADWEIPLERCFHHAAHFAAVLAENHLVETPESVLGIIWDGAGYGEDGQIWGGEILLYRDRRIERLDHVAYYPVLAGDQMARQPLLAALSIGRAQPAVLDRVRNMMQPTAWALYTSLLAGVRQQTSSMGRVFDAVAGVLGLATHNSYEGEAALLLETEASAWLAQGHDVQPFDLPADGLLDAGAWLAAVCRALDDGQQPGAIAAQFHQTLVGVIAAVARRSGVRHLAFSGGVWQSALLLDMIHQQLRPEFDLWLHHHLPPGDECIAIGQLTLYDYAITSSTPIEYVSRNTR